MQIFAGTANYVPATSVAVIHTKAGKLRGILFNASGAGSIVFSDNNTGGAPILLTLNAPAAQAPVFLDFPMYTPLVFAHGLTVVTSANVNCLVITEA
jgi:hypothetical protein